MLDAIELERLGVPAANISTDAFLVSVREMCQVQGIPDYPVAVMPHPLTSLTPGELRARMDALVGRVVALLTEGRA